jgi:hypothetical protein
MRAQAYIYRCIKEEIEVKTLKELNCLNSKERKIHSIARHKWLGAVG